MLVKGIIKLKYDNVVIDTDIMEMATQMVGKPAHNLNGVDGKIICVDVLDHETLEITIAVDLGEGNCPKCGYELDINWIHCPICGRETN